MRKDDQTVDSMGDALGNPGCGCVVILGILMFVGVLVWGIVAFSRHGVY